MSQKPSNQATSVVELVPNPQTQSSEVAEAITTTNSQAVWEDAYQRLRKRVRKHLKTRALPSEKLRSPLQGLVEYVAVLPDLFHLAIRMLFDPVMPLQKKALMVAALTYVASPVDVIPDFIPVVGQLDDLVVLTKAIKLLLDASDPAVRAAAEGHWAGEQDLLQTVTTVVDVADELLTSFPAGFKSVLDKVLNS